MCTANPVSRACLMAFVILLMEPVVVTSSVLRRPASRA